MVQTFGNREEQLETETNLKTDQEPNIILEYKVNLICLHRHCLMEYIETKCTHIRTKAADNLSILGIYT